MMDIKNVHSLAPLRKLDYDYGGPPLRKFGERDVRVGSQARSGRARADRFRGLGRTFKSMLARVADHFHFPQSRSARRFNRAHEAYSREADRLLDGLAAKGSEIDPEELVDHLGWLKTHADEMAKHIAMEGPDGEKMTREDAKAMGRRGRKKLKWWSAAQARALRKELLAARVDVALKKAPEQRDPRENSELKSAFNAINWETVEARLAELRDDQYRNEYKKLEEQDDWRRELGAYELRVKGVRANAGIVSDLRTIRDLVVTSGVADTDPDRADADPDRRVGRRLGRILQALDDGSSHPNLQGFEAKLNALERMRDIPLHRLERVFRDRVAQLSRDDAGQLCRNLMDEVRDLELDPDHICFAAWFPESGQEALKVVAKRAHGMSFQVDDESIDDDLRGLRQDLKNFLTLGELLVEHSASTGETFREQVVGNHREGVGNSAGLDGSYATDSSISDSSDSDIDSED